MYVEYPKVMRHPHHRPAQVERPSPGKPLLPGEEPQEPKAAVFPPVTVMNVDQENQHRALGYLCPDSDKTGWDPPMPLGYYPVEYPKWVGDVLVNCREEEDALTGDVVLSDGSLITYGETAFVPSSKAKPKVRRKRKARAKKAAPKKAPVKVEEPEKVEVEA